MLSRHIFPVGLGTSLALFATSAFAQTAETVGTYGHHGYMSGHGGGHGPWFGIIGVIVFIVIIGLVMRAVGGGMGCCHHRRSKSGAALAILEERYAKGEIDAAEFEDRKRTLTAK